MPKVVFRGRPYRVIGVAVDYDVYLALREIARVKGVGLSDLLREIIDDFLRRHGLKEAEIVAHQGNIITLGQIEQRVLAIEFNESLSNLERMLSRLEREKRGSITYYDLKEKVHKEIKKTINVAHRLGVPSEKSLTKLYKLVEKYEEITQEKVKEKPWV